MQFTNNKKGQKPPLKVVLYTIDLYFLCSTFNILTIVYVENTFVIWNCQVEKSKDNLLFFAVCHGKNLQWKRIMFNRTSHYIRIWKAWMNSLAWMCCSVRAGLCSHKTLWTPLSRYVNILFVDVSISTWLFNTTALNLICMNEGWAMYKQKSGPESRPLYFTDNNCRKKWKISNCIYNFINIINAILHFFYYTIYSAFLQAAYSLPFGCSVMDFPCAGSEALIDTYL